MVILELLLLKLTVLLELLDGVHFPIILQTITDSYDSLRIVSFSFMAKQPKYGMSFCVYVFN